MRLVKITALLLVLAVMTVVAAGCGSGKPAAPEKKTSYPEKPIEFAVGYSPGGGTDIFASTVAKYLNELKIVNQPITVTNKPGAAGALAMTYVKEKKGDPYTLLLLPSLGTPIIMGNAGAEYADFIPLARLAAESNMIVVPKNSSFQTIEDLVKEIKARPGQVMAGGTSATGNEAFQWYKMSKLFGADVNYIPFNSGGEVTAALMGGQVEVALSNPSEGLEQVKAGEWRALAVLSKDRLRELPDVPTLKEKGYDFVWYMDRAAWIGAGVPEEVVAFWDDAFKKLHESEQWQKEYVEKNMLLGDYLNAKAYQEYLPKAAKQFEEFLIAVGALKK